MISINRTLAASAFLALLLTDAMAANNASLIFNGSTLRLTSNSSSSAAQFTSDADPDFVETVVLRSAENDGTFSAAVRALVKRARSDSHGAKLRMLERSGGEEIIVVYLADGPSQKIVFKAERLSRGRDAHIVAMSYQAEFEAGTIDSDNEKKIKGTAVDALAKFDLTSVGSFIELKP